MVKRAYKDFEELPYLDYRPFIEIELRHECSANLQHIFRQPSPKNTSEVLILTWLTGKKNGTCLGRLLIY